MIAVDTNILVYTHRRESRLGEASHYVMVGLAEGDEAWTIPWPCCYEFMSVVTNRRIWLKTAQLLAGGGFADEAHVPALDAIRLTAGSLAAMPTFCELSHP